MDAKKKIVEKKADQATDEFSGVKFLILKLDFSIRRVTQENSKIGDYYATYRRRLRVSRQHDGSRAAIEDSKRGARERHKIRISWPESRG